jgi:hypothetical protein
MRYLLIAILVCACVHEDELDDETSQLWNDDGHCPPGGGGHSPGDGSGGGGPGPKPDRKPCEDLGQYPTVEGCKQCCYYNYDHVDGWECRRKRTERARARCWREATEKMGRCNAQCERDRGVITTIIGTPP